MWRKLYFSGNDYYHYYYCCSMIMIPFFFRLEIGVYTAHTHTHTHEHYNNKILYGQTPLPLVQYNMYTTCTVDSDFRTVCVYTVLQVHHRTASRKILIIKKKKKVADTGAAVYILNHVMCTPIYNVYTRKYIYVYNVRSSERGDFKCLFLNIRACTSI